MGKILKFILIIQLIGSVGSIISKLYSQPIILLASLAINILIWIGLWKGTSYAINHPEGQATSNKIANIIRWVMLFIFSIFAVEIGTIFSFILRFLIDSAYVNGNALAVAMVRGAGPMYGNIIIVIGLLFSFPLIEFISKSLKFKKPINSSIISTIVWAFLILLLGSLIRV